MRLVACYVRFVMGNTKKTKHQNWTKNRKITYENKEKSSFEPSFKKAGRVRSPNINSNLYFIMGIIVLQFQMDPYDRTKVIEQKPVYGHAHNIITPQNF